MRIGRFAALIAALATAAGAQEAMRAAQEPVVARAAVATDIATDIAYAELEPG